MSVWLWLFVLTAILLHWNLTNQGLTDNTNIPPLIGPIAAAALKSVYVLAVP